MKIELSIDSNGNPCIAIENILGTDDLSEKVLQTFISKALNNGLSLVKTDSETADIFTKNYWEIRIRE